MWGSETDRVAKSPDDQWGWGEGHSPGLIQHEIFFFFNVKFSSLGIVTERRDLGPYLQRVHNPVDDT